MNDFLNKWFYYPWSPTLYDPALLHPDDRDIEGLGAVKCVNIEDKYLLLKNKNVIVRALPSGIKLELPFPKFEWHNKILEKHGEHRKGEIFDLFWHFKKEEYCYYIIIDGQKRNRRYLEEELILITDEE